MSVIVKQDGTLATRDTRPVTSLLEVISRAASDPSVDVEKMERLMAMHERITAGQAKAAFNAAMSECQAEMPVIVGKTKNSQTGSFYAALDELDRVAKPIYTRHGFALSFGTADCPIQGWYRETCVVSQREGHSETRFADLPPDLVGIKGNPNKTGVQGFGSTMSYGQRYLTKLIFNIVIVGEDKDGNEPAKTISETQIADLTALCTEVGADPAKFRKMFCKVDSFDQILAKNYDFCVTELRRYGREKQAKPK